MPRAESSFQATWEGIRADYDAAKPHRLVRTRRALGGSADAHLGSPRDFWQLRELARDLDRNHEVIGQAVDRACDNILGDGLQPDPDTGDPTLNAELKQRFWDWAGEGKPGACDARRMHAFAKLEWLALRHRFVDGDIFVVPLTDGSLQVIEGERVTTPTNTKRNVVHGVLLDEITGAPVEYWIAKRRDHLQRIERVGDIQVLRAFDEDGERNVYHILDSKRISMTRGVTAFAPVFTMTSMFGDVNLAKLVQSQVISCIAAFITSDGTNKFGDTQQQQDEDFTRHLEKLRPGLIARLNKGDQIHGFSPNVPNSEYFEHVRLIVRLIGCNLGLPLSLILLDTSSTTFHGYRGELEQARIGFRRIRRDLCDQFHTPLWRWLVARWAPSLQSPAAKGKLQSGEIFRNTWRGKGFPYIDPQKDAVADKIQLENMLESPRQIYAQRGRDVDEVRRETIEDNAKTINDAIEAAKSIQSQTGEKVTWREILNPRFVEKAPAAPSPRSPLMQNGEEPEADEDEDKQENKDAD